MVVLINCQLLILTTLIYIKDIFINYLKKYFYSLKIKQHIFTRISLLLLVFIFSIRALLFNSYNYRKDKYNFTLALEVLFPFT